MMIQAVLAPIIHRRGQIEIPALHLGFALAKHFFRRGAHGDWRHSWRCADSFLRAAEANVNSPATFRKASILVSTPVEVSPCASPIILVCLPLPARRTSSGSTGLP